jgi:hypothetical protein
MERSPRNRSGEKLFGHLGFTDPRNKSQKRYYTRAKSGGLQAVPSLGFDRRFYGTPERLRDEHVDQFVTGAKNALRDTPFSYLSHLVPTNELDRIQ